jgi:hypothetical protein
MNTHPLKGGLPLYLYPGGRTDVRWIKPTSCRSKMHPWRWCGNTPEACGIWWKGEVGQLGVWPAGPTWQPLAAPVGLVSSGVFYTLVVYVSLRIILIIIDTLILILLFSRINSTNL